MAILLANNATAKLAGSINTATTSLTVQTGQGALFPSPSGGDYFPLTLVDSSGNIEITYCTSRSGDILTVTRAREGTSAKSFAAGSRASLRVTDGVFDYVFNVIDNALLRSIIAQATQADRMTYYTGANQAAMTVLTPFARTLLDDADASTALSTLGVSAFAKTLLDDADSIAAMNTLALRNGSGSAVEYDITTPAKFLRWDNYGTGHVIFDASKGKSPAGTDIDKANAQAQWMATYPTLMGWNGSQTYGLRVDSARISDAAITADRITGTVATSGQDLTISGKRALVGDASANKLFINYASDWSATVISGNVEGVSSLSLQKLLSLSNGSSNWSDSGVEVRVNNGSTQTPRIALHRPGVAAAAFRLEADGTVILESANPSTLTNFVASKLYANDGMDGSAAQLTRKDYVDAVFEHITNWKYRGRYEGNDLNAFGGLGSFSFTPSAQNNPTGGYGHGFTFGDPGFSNGNWASQFVLSHGNGLYHRSVVNGSFGAWEKIGVVGAANAAPNKTEFLSVNEWVGAAFGQVGATDRVVAGNISGAAVVGAHNSLYSAWAPLYLNCCPGSGATAVTVLSDPKIKVQSTDQTLYDVWGTHNLAVSAFAKTMLDDADAASVRATINAQTAATALNALGSLTPAASRLPYFTGSSSAALASLGAIALDILASNNVGEACTAVGAAQIASFGSVIGTNGYIKIPRSAGGVIYVQWGKVAAMAANATASVTFPTAFPAACDNIVCTPTNNVNTASMVANPDAITTTGFTMRGDTDNANNGVFWIAIGR